MRTNEVIVKNVSQIPDILNKCNANKPFLCCSKSFKNTGAYYFILKHCNVTVFDEIRPNPEYESMVKAAEIFNQNNCDFIIGAGGGSALDSAKMIKLLSTNKDLCGYTQQLQDNCIPFLAIPTTSGTGSEATRYSIFYVNKNEKHSVSHPGFLPDYVLLNAQFLKTVPLYQRKCTCLDALCHGVESYWNVKSTDVSKDFAKKAIMLFFEAKDEYMQNKERGNEKMLMASYYAGKAIDITATTSAHAMCYNLTMNCSTSHGHSVALCLTKIWQYMNQNNSLVNDCRGREYVLSTFDEIGKLMGGKNSADGQQIFENLLLEFDMQKATATKDKINEFAHNINVDRLKNNPTVLTEKDIQNLYSEILL